MSKGTARSAHRLCLVSDLERSGFFTAWLDAIGDEVSAVRDATGTYVFSSVCPHFGGPFAFDRRAGVARCAWHGWQFDYRSGRCLSYDVKTCLRHYEWAITDAGVLEVYVDA